jgi:hypothetical protein
VTADGVRNSIEADPDAPDAVLLTEEVTGVLFEFTDGTSWTGTWDGTVPGPDGVTPLGPPRAIKVTLDLRVPSGRGEPIAKTVSQVIAVRSAPGTYTPPLLEAPTDGATEGGTTSDPSASGTGGTTTSETQPSGTSGGMSTGASTGGTTPAGGKTGGSQPSGSTGGSRPGGSTGGSPSAPSGGKTGGSPSAPTGGGKTGGNTGGGKR